MPTVTPRPKVRVRVKPALLPRQIELQSDGDAIQWRYIGDAAWTDIVEIDDLDATVAVGSVTTLSPGESATVVNSGTNQAAVLNFGIPRGINGQVVSVVAGAGISVNSTDPTAPIVSASLSSLNAEDITFDPAGNIAATDVQAAIEELDAEKQPLDSDLTALAGVATQTYGRGLLTYASEAAFKTGTGLADTAKLNVVDQVITGGARVTPDTSLGTITTGTVTLDPGDRPLQSYTNGGAHTLAPGANTGYLLLDITNNGSAGAITVSGWTKVVGAFTTTNGHKFRCGASVSTAGSLLTIQAMQ